MIYYPQGVGSTTSPNKELKLTKPSVLELRSLTPVLARHADESEGPPAVDLLVEAWLAVQG
jgi:hypothetical protein